MIKNMLGSVELGQEVGGAGRSCEKMSSLTITEGGPAISSLTITEGEDAIQRNETNFTAMAGEVESPGDVMNSLNGKPVNLSKMSLLGVSGMSLGDVDIDPEEFS